MEQGRGSCLLLGWVPGAGHGGTHPSTPGHSRVQVAYTRWRWVDGTRVVVVSSSRSVGLYVVPTTGPLFGGMQPTGCEWLPPMIRGMWMW